MMDASSKFFFGLEKKNGQSRFIHALRSETRQELRDSNEIRRQAVCFYSELDISDYKEDKEMFMSFLWWITKSRCGNQCRIGIDVSPPRNARKGERPLALTGFRWSFFKDLLLLLSSRRVAITLYPKKGDLQEFKNWRPVSLLCSDYKDGHPGQDNNARPHLACTTGAVTLRSIVAVAGTGLNQAVAVASLLGQKSIRQTRTLLRRWTERLTEEEFQILQDYGSGVETPDEGDPFPDLGFPPDLDGYSGPLVDVGSLERLDLTP
ncbi:hypothetical protein NHX12_031284 [Muraenolepis orangiensis]|uniref:Uncharacterized protein n=1 Tax=Muraenolepis orangiensis TaxID=630683 RepID=A0A9Q0E5C1_9TELE|nr:hypothetical protein NHX12_031284 [Muraenolepis orangiensis]